MVMHVVASRQERPPCIRRCHGEQSGCHSSPSSLRVGGRMALKGSGSPSRHACHGDYSREQQPIKMEEPQFLRDGDVSDIEGKPNVVADVAPTSQTEKRRRRLQADVRWSAGNAGPHYVRGLPVQGSTAKTTTNTTTPNKTSDIGSSSFPLSPVGLSCERTVDEVAAMTTTERHSSDEPQEDNITLPGGHDVSPNVAAPLVASQPPSASRRFDDGGSGDSTSGPTSGSVSERRLSRFLPSILSISSCSNESNTCSSNKNTYPIMSYRVNRNNPGSEMTHQPSADDSPKHVKLRSPRMEAISTTTAENNKSHSSSSLIKPSPSHPAVLPTSTKTTAPPHNNNNTPHRYNTIPKSNNNNNNNNTKTPLLLMLCVTALSWLGPHVHCCYVYPPDVKDPCRDKPCSFGAQCVPSLDGLTARCQCPQRCDTFGDSVGSTPVCGSDGKDYSSMCEMRRSACSEMKDTSVKYFGKCGEYKGFPQMCRVLVVFYYPPEVKRGEYLGSGVFLL